MIFNPCASQLPMYPPPERWKDSEIGRATRSARGLAESKPERLRTNVAA